MLLLGRGLDGRDSDQRRESLKRHAAFRGYPIGVYWSVSCVRSTGVWMKMFAMLGVAVELADMDGGSKNLESWEENNASPQQHEGSLKWSAGAEHH